VALGFAYDVAPAACAERTQKQNGAMACLASRNSQTIRPLVAWRRFVPAVFRAI